MPDAEPGWEDLIDGVRRGEPRAMNAFFRRYGPALERLAARAIEPGMRRRFGPETIAQSVCRSFVMRAGSREYELADGDSLWRLLCAIALTKVREKARFHLRQKRGVDREVHERDGLPHPAAGVPAEGSRPEDDAIFREQFTHLLTALEGEERDVLELRIAGRSQLEIAEVLQISERTVRRILNRVEDRFLRSLAD